MTVIWKSHIKVKHFLRKVGNLYAGLAKNSILFCLFKYFIYLVTQSSCQMLRIVIATGQTSVTGLLICMASYHVKGKNLC
jgi:hypothetical protein